MIFRRSAGFTLIELLVVIAIVSVLLLLLLPAINTVRELGRRTQCINNQRNIALGMINYEATHRSFPPALAHCTDEAFNSLGTERGVSCLGPNWAVQILAQMDADLLHDQVVDCLRHQWHACDDCPEQLGHVGMFTPSYMQCPSAPIAAKLHHSPRTGLEDLSKGNYGACLGSEHFRTAIERSRIVRKDSDDAKQMGVLTVVMIRDYPRLVRGTLAGDHGGEWKFAHGQGTRTVKIKDGTSKTIVVSELLSVDGEAVDRQYSEDIRGVWTCASMGASTYTHKYGPNSSMADRINGCEQSLPDAHPLHCRQAPVQGARSAETWASARSAHDGGVVAVAADSSVRFYTNDIHLPVWQSLASRAGE